MSTAPIKGELYLYEAMIVEIVSGVVTLASGTRVVCYDEVTSAAVPVGCEIREADWSTAEPIPTALAAAIRRAVSGAAPDWLAEVS